MAFAGSRDTTMGRMENRKLGRSGLLVAPLAFGGNVFGWTADEKASFALLDAYVEAGFNLVDTADVYARWAPGNRGGESETILGRWFARSGKRDRVIVATKVGMEVESGKGLSKAHIQRAVEDSLRRLQTDVIDLYQSHLDDPETPLAETLEAFSELVKAGKVRAIGASNYGSPRLAEALRLSESKHLPRYESLQPLYNLYDRETFEKELASLCRETGIGVIPYFSLASGFLTGKYRSEADLAKSQRGDRVRKYLNPRGLRILDALDQVARELSAKPSQVALAWLLSKPVITAPIASATSVAQLQEILRATELKLTPQALALLEQASAP